MTDSAFLFHVLEDGEWHGQAEILARSMTERGHGLTVHSRAADLRKRGCVVECDLRRNGNGRALSYYRLVTLAEPEAAIVGSGLASGSASVPAAASTPYAEPSTADESASPPVDPGGTLELFVCNVDESAGLRGAYTDGTAA